MGVWRWFDCVLARFRESFKLFDELLLYSEVLVNGGLFGVACEAPLLVGAVELRIELDHASQ